MTNRKLRIEILQIMSDGEKWDINNICANLYQNFHQLNKANKKQIEDEIQSNITALTNYSGGYSSCIKKLKRNFYHEPQTYIMENNAQEVLAEMARDYKDSEKITAQIGEIFHKNRLMQGNTPITEVTLCSTEMFDVDVTKQVLTQMVKDKVLRKTKNGYMYYEQSWFEKVHRDLKKHSITYPRHLISFIAGAAFSYIISNWEFIIDSFIGFIQNITT